MSLNCNNATEPYILFLQKFLVIFEENCPMQKTKLSRSQIPRRAWMTKGLVRSCNKKSPLYKDYKSNHSEANKSIFIHYRNKLKLFLDLTEKIYYRDRFKLFSGNLTQTWKLLNKVLNKDFVLIIIFYFRHSYLRSKDFKKGRLFSI